jgi:hypothetical protein
MILRRSWSDSFIATAGALACVLAAAAVVARGPLGLLVLAGLVGLALVVVFEEIGFGVLLGWIVLSGPVYPLLSTGATDLPVGFDRVVVAGMGTWLLTRPGGPPWSPGVKRLAWALAWLTAAFGIRAALTDRAGTIAATAGDAQTVALNTWIDAVVLPVMLFLIVARYATSLGRVRRVAGSMALAGAVLGVIGLIVKIGGFDLAAMSGGSTRIDQAIGVVRVAGPYSVPEVYALVLLMCLAATVYWTQTYFAEVYPLGLAAIVLELAGIGVTLFRAAMIGALMILIAGVGLRPGRVLRMLAVVLVAGTAVLLAYNELQDDRVISARLQNTENINGRFATYAQGVDLFEGQPLTGVGVGQFANAQASVEVTVVGGVEAVTSPHSTFVGMLAEQGVVGTLPLLACALAAWLLIGELRRRARRRSDVILWSCLVGAALAYLVMSLTLTMLPYGPSNAFFAIMLGLGAARINSLRLGEQPQA